MFDTNGQWIRLESFDDFDNGLDGLIELWSSATSEPLKQSALTRFKENLDAVTLEWIDSRAKSKKYAAIAEELAEFEAVLALDVDVESDKSIAPRLQRSLPNT